MKNSSQITQHFYVSWQISSREHNFYSSLRTSVDQLRTEPKIFPIERSDYKNIKLYAFQYAPLKDH